MRILIGIDDTDNSDSVGTGKLLENLIIALCGEYSVCSSFVTRHQLYVREDIPYTTHNSTMCCEAEINDLRGTIDFCRSFMDESCAAGSGPGLCIIDLDRLKYKKRIIRFGQAAKKMILKKRDALDMAQLHRQAIYLTEHGGSGAGVIGALAGCGLRLSGSDGKVRGELQPSALHQVMTVCDLCSMFSLSMAMDKEKRPVNASDTVFFGCPTTAILWNHSAALYLQRDKSGAAKWRVCSTQEIKGLVD